MLVVGGIRRSRDLPYLLLVSLVQLPIDSFLSSLQRNSEILPAYLLVPDLLSNTPISLLKHLLCRYLGDTHLMHRVGYSCLGIVLESFEAFGVVHPLEE